MELWRTAQTPNSLTLAWREGRPGTRGYNVYAQAGANCPASKYYLVTSVCGHTSVTLDVLTAGTNYAVTVTAINEDGKEGPAASLQAHTASGCGERKPFGR